MSTVQSDPLKVPTLPSARDYRGFWLWHLLPMVLLIVIPQSFWIPFPHEPLAAYQQIEPEEVFNWFLKDLCIVQSQCQIGMLAAWIFWGAGLWGKRLLQAIGLLAIVYAPFIKAMMINMEFDSSFIPIIFMVGIFYVAIPFLVSLFVIGGITLLGWRVVQQTTANPSPFTYQYSLRHLFLALLLTPLVIGGVSYFGSMYLRTASMGGVDQIITIGGWNIRIAMVASLLLMGLILSGKSYLWRIGWTFLIAVVLLVVGSGVLVSAEGKELFETLATDSLCLLIGAEIVFYGISWCWLRKANLAFGRVQRANRV